MKKFFIFLTLFVLTMATLDAQESLPVTKVVLFTNGVAFVEHSGAVQGDTTLRFNFTTNQIKDLLKSLILIDEGGGTVDLVRYPSQEPLSRILASFSVNLDEVVELEQVLMRLRGAEVTVTTSSPVVGRLLGVENRQAVRDNVVLTELYLNLFTTAGIQSIPLRSVMSIQPNDALLREEFQKALQLIAASRNDDQKTLEMSFRGRGRRNVRIGYVTESPVWKTSYRLDLNSPKSFIQAWAIVENITEQDWTNINLSLVSGRPNSFIQDLYSPVYSPRPVIQPQISQNLVPTTPKLAMTEDELPPGRERLRSSQSEVAMAAPSVPPPSPMRLQDSGVQAQAQGSITGELYQFSISTPVSLPRRQSALIPIYLGEIQAEKISYYNPAQYATNTMNAVWLTNSTNNDFPAGPITLFDRGIYAGDALAEGLPRQQKRILPYGIDLRLNVQSEQSHASFTSSLKIVRGVLNFQRRVVYTQTYRFSNSGEEAKTLILEHPIRSGTTLRQPDRFEERTATHYRFRTLVPKTTGQSFEVVEEQLLTKSIAILPMARNQVLSYITNQDIPPRIQQALQRAADLKGKLEGLNQEIRDLERQRGQVESGQQRVRDNLAAVGRDSPQGRRFLDQLMQQEDQIAQFNRDIDKKRQEIQSTQRELEQYLAGLNLE